MAEQNPRLEYLKAEIADRIKGGKYRSRYYQVRAFWPFMTATCLSAIVTVLLGFTGKPLTDTFRLIALGLTALVTMLNAYNAFYSDKELWVANNNALNRFYRLNFNIAYAEQGDKYISDAETEEFKAIYQDILDELNASWQKNRLSKK